MLNLTIALLCFFISAPSHATTLLWSGSEYNSNLLGIDSLAVDGETYNVSFLSGTAHDLFFNTDTQDFDLTFNTVDSAFQAAEALSLTLTALNIPTQSINGISSWGSGYIETLHSTTYLPDAFGEPATLIDGISSKGIWEGETPYINGSTKWSTVDLPPLGWAKNNYTGSSYTFAKWKAAPVPEPSGGSLMLLSSLALIFYRPKKSNREDQ